jgi:hypothetical protein
MNSHSQSPLRTVVFQSCRPTNIPPWMQRCLDSTKAWALMNGYEYRFIGDELFAPVPEWYVQRCWPERLPVTDLARLLWARQLLNDEWDRVIWVDADVLIFAPDRFDVGMDRYALARELWLTREPDGTISRKWAVNNCVMVYCAGNPFLEFYIEACQLVIRHMDRPVHKLDTAPRLLTGLHGVAPLPFLRSVAMFCPGIVHELATVPGPFVEAHTAHWPDDIHAANLCGSMCGEVADPPWSTDAGTLEIAIEVLTRGRHFSSN